MVRRARLFASGRRVCQVSGFYVWRTPRTVCGGVHTMFASGGRPNMPRQWVLLARMVWKPWYAWRLSRGSGTSGLTSVWLELAVPVPRSRRAGAPGKLQRGTLREGRVRGSVNDSEDSRANGPMGNGRAGGGVRTLGIFGKNAGPETTRGGQAQRLHRNRARPRPRPMFPASFP